MPDYSPPAPPAAPLPAAAAPQADPWLNARGITKTYGRFSALRDVSFTAGRGEFLCVLGPSGCGKTTALRIVAGLERQDAGSVRFGGEDVSLLPVSKRGVGIVFQSYALFPNLTATANVAYGLENGSNMKRREINRRVDELMDLVGLRGLGAKFPAQLSGGQQQRVALARAMALSPRLLLLDEPLSALDAQVRVKLRSEIRALQQRLQVTTIMVTHDQEEALTMADRILVMDGGSVAQDGAPADIYDHPATPFVAGFIGSMNFLAGAAKRDHGVWDLGGAVLAVTHCRADIPVGAAALAAIRPEDILLGDDVPAADGANRFSAKVRALEYRGPVFRVGLSLFTTPTASVSVEADVPAEQVRRLGLAPEQVTLARLPADRIRVYPE